MTGDDDQIELYKRLLRDRPLYDAVRGAIEAWAEPLTAATAGMITTRTWQGEKLLNSLTSAIVRAVKDVTASDPP